MTRRKVAEIVVDVLEKAGVERCYGVVGDTLNHVTDAMRRSKIAFVHMRHEEAGAFAAGAEALVTGRMAACAGSCGPGSLHFINGIFESHRNRAPVVLIASQVASGELGIEFPQEIDFKPLYAQCSVFCEEIASPAQARRLATLAAQTALAKRGVAVLILSGDVSAMEIEDEVTWSVHAPSPVVRPSDGELDRIADILGKGKRVAIYAGAGCERARDQVVSLCARLKAPMAHTSRAKDFLEPDNPFNVGMTGIFGGRAGFHTVSACDTLLLLGCDFAWRQFYPQQARVVQIDVDATHLGRRHPVELGVVGDIGPSLEALIPRLAEAPEAGFLETCLKLRREDEAELERQATAGRDDLIHPQRLAALISRYAADDAIFTADGGSPMVWLLRHVAAKGARRTIVSLLHGTMAGAMPQALGVKKALPNRQVIAFSGDGGLAMLLGDLLTAVQEAIPIKVVVFNNGALGFVELEMKVEGLMNAYTDLANPDFAKLAEVIGFAGWRVETNAALEGAIEAFLAHPGPAMLDVKVNRDELVVPPKIEAAMVTGTMLYGAKAVLSGHGGDVVDLLESNLIR